MSVTAIRPDRNRFAGLAANRFLGAIVIFTIAGAAERDEDGRRVVVPVRVNQDALARWFQELKLAIEFLPPRIKKIDAWRNATTQAPKHTYDVTHGGETHRAELVIEETKSDTDQVVREILRRTRNVDGPTKPVQMATLKFIRGGRTSAGKRSAGDHTRSTILTKIRNPDRAEVSSLIDEIDDLYEDLSNNLHAPAIRGVIRTYLEALNAIPIRGSGGIYFIPRENWSEVDGLQELVDRISQGCVLEQIPLLDTDDARRMLADAFQAEVEEECRKLERKATEVRAAAKAKKARVPLGRFAELDSALRTIMDRAERYTELGLPMGKAADALERCYELIAALRQEAVPNARRSRK